MHRDIHPDNHMLNRKTSLNKFQSFEIIQHKLPSHKIKLEINNKDNRKSQNVWISENKGTYF